MSAPLPPDPYRALGVEPSADAGSIKTAYRKLVLKCHPDKFPDPTLKAQKQEEFQKVQQAYEILGDDDRRRDYDLEVKAKKLREELAKRGGTATGSQSTHSRQVNINIRTAEPPPGWSPSKHASKSSPYKTYPKEFSQSWEHEIPSRSRAYHEDERRARRAASYEKPKREDSRERRKREEDSERAKRREREREREEEMMRKDIRREQRIAKEREAAAREREREREKDRERKEQRRAREEREREAARLKEAKKMRERESRRRQEAEEKARAKSKPYLEHPPYSGDDNDDVQRSRAKKSSSPKKQSASPSRDKSAKQRERPSPVEASPGEDSNMRDKLSFAASYIKNKASKTSPRHAAEAPTWSAAYPDPNEKFAPKRRTSGDGRYAKEEPVIIDAPEPDEAHPEVASPPSNSKQAPPRLQKSHTMPTGYMPQTQTAAPAPPRVPLSRAFTMQPEHEYSRPTEKHRSAKKRSSFDDESYDYYQAPAPIHRTYQVSKDTGVPRVVDAKYRDPYSSMSGVAFSKVKTAPAYEAEHVATSRHYGEDDVMTSDYSHMHPQYYERTTAVR
jgi:curved DNA-binding protein CbpA